MGKGKVRRKSLLKQFLTSFFMVMIYSMVTAVILITAFYMAYHRINGEGGLSLSNPKLISMIEFIHQYGSSIEDNAIRRQLDVLAQSNNVDYYVEDKDNNIRYIAGMGEGEAEGKNNLQSAISDIRSNLHNTTSIQIPMMDQKTGQIQYMFVMTSYGSITWIVLLCVDVGIPVVCFLVYTYIFARRFSKRLRLPLQELMCSVKKIKERDLDFSINITNENEIGELAQALEEMRHELRNSLIKQWQLEQDRRDMVAAITHDIRTPIAIIQGHVEGLSEGIKDNPEKLNAYLITIEQNVNRTKKLVDDMNALVEIDSEGFIMDASLVELSQFMEDKINEIKILTDKKGIQLESSFMDERKEALPICLDTNRLSQIIDNIVSNSIRFTPEGGSIQIITQISKAEAVFRICDTGEGFLEKDIPNLFKKFYKGDYSRSKEKGHSGLGLYIAKSIVERYGGQIRANNLENGGACMEFSLKI